MKLLTAVLNRSNTINISIPTIQCNKSVRFYHRPLSQHSCMTQSGSIPPAKCRAAVYQGQSMVYNVQRNYENVKHIIQVAANDNQCELLLFPELCM